MTVPASSSTRRSVAPLTLALVCSATGWVCNAPRQPGTASAEESAQQRIQRLEREARALARPNGCQAGADCRAAPVGHRPCGGPRTYLVYCARTTDSVALYRTLDELARAERAYNEQQGLVSTCEFRAPPRVVAIGGSCRAAAP